MDCTKYDNKAQEPGRTVVRFAPNCFRKTFQENTFDIDGPLPRRFRLEVEVLQAQGDGEVRVAELRVLGICGPLVVHL